MSNTTRNKIAKNIKEVRSSRGLTQLELANMASISANSYARIERGEVSPSLETFEKLVKALGISSSDVLPF